MTTATSEAVKLTDRINRIEPSATMAVVAEADKLRAQGVDVVDFGAGEPHFATPQQGWATGHDGVILSAHSRPRSGRLQR